MHILTADSFDPRVERNRHSCGDGVGQRPWNPPFEFAYRWTAIMLPIVDLEVCTDVSSGSGCFKASSQGLDLCDLEHVEERVDEPDFAAVAKERTHRRCERGSSPLNLPATRASE